MSTAAAAALTASGHYIASAGYFVGGFLSTVAHLWLIYGLLNVVGVPRKLRYLHTSLAIANLTVVAIFIFGTVSHFEQRWYFGNFWCRFYIFIAIFAVTAAAGNLAAVLCAEYKRAFNPKFDPEVSVSCKVPLALAWSNALFWGLAAVGGWAETEIESAGYTCTVTWYKPSSYVNGLVFVGFGVPIAVSTYVAVILWKNRETSDALTAICAKLVATTWIQYSVFALAYVWILVTGKDIPLLVLALAPIVTKAGGLLHPLVYGRSFYQRGAACRKTQ